MARLRFRLLWCCRTTAACVLGCPLPSASAAAVPPKGSDLWRQTLWLLLCPGMGCGRPSMPPCLLVPPRQGGRWLSSPPASGCLVLRRVGVLLLRMAGRAGGLAV